MPGIGSEKENISPSTSKDSEPHQGLDLRKDGEDKLLEDKQELKASSKFRTDGNKRLIEESSSNAEHKRMKLDQVDQEATQPEPVDQPQDQVDPQANQEEAVDQQPEQVDQEPIQPAEVDNSIYGGLSHELLEKILENVEDSRDVVNFFRAFPQLNGSISNNSYGPLFGQIIPIIYRELSKEDILKCRQVCKTWNSAVDSFLENHPTRRAYNLGVEIPGQRWLPEASLHKSKMYKRFELMWSYIPFQCLQKSSEIYAHPKNRNPFVGRALTIHDKFRLSIRSFWDEVLGFLKVFGRHIWFLDICFNLVNDCFYFCQLLMQILKLLPNLKKLKITADPILTSTLTTYIKKRQHHLVLPALNHLESFEIMPYPSTTLLEIFITSYSQQFRRLTTDGRLWKSEYSTLFPRLTQLDLFGYLAFYDARKMLTKLVASKDLTMLTFGLSGCHSSGIGNSIIPLILAGFPHLRSLKIRIAGKQYGREIAQSDELIKPSQTLKSFCLWGLTDADMDFEFLELFPNLEYIKILYHTLPDYFDAIYDPVVWEVAPKLKEVVLRQLTEPKSDRYTRGEYECMRVYDEYIHFTYANCE